MEYSICQGYVVLNEYGEFVDWFDDFEDAEKFVEEVKERYFI